MIHWMACAINIYVHVVTMCHTNIRAWTFNALVHAGNGHGGNKHYPDSVVSDKHFPPSPIHVSSLRAPLSKSTPVVSEIMACNFYCGVASHYMIY